MCSNDIPVMRGWLGWRQPTQGLAMTAASKVALDDTLGVAPMRDAATHGYVFNHTMLRVKDPRASLDFYTRVLGFSLLRKVDHDEAGFSLYFLALLDDVDGLPEEPDKRREWLARQRGVLELTHNHGTEHEVGPVYHDGNSEPRGFGHLCVSVPDVRAACARMEGLGVAFQKRLQDGSMKSIAFVKDPDGYWIELLQPGPLD
jgi:lactoylglutathione lyase